MIPAAFRYRRPRSLPEALEQLSEPGARPLAGGQSILNALKLRLVRVESLVDISRLEELRFLRSTPDGGVAIGAGVTYAELLDHPVVLEHHPKIAEICAGTVDEQVRSRGTLGGNCCYADPSSNFPPLMAALDATMVIATEGGERRVQAEEFVRGFCWTAVGQGELLHSVELPRLEAGTGIGYSSLQLAKDSWALARAAVTVRANGTIEDSRVVLGCVSPAPARQPEVESRLQGASPGDGAAIAGAAEAACEGVEPISDVHASGSYRRRMAKVMTARALREALGIERGARAAA